MFYIPIAISRLLIKIPYQAVVFSGVEYVGIVRWKIILGRVRYRVCC